MKITHTRKLFTIPNWITIGRIICVPFVVYFLLVSQPRLALIVFVAAALSDAIDGFLARYFKARSVIGAYLDPIADKILFLSTFVTLGYLRIIPFWLIVLSVLRDVTIVSGVFALRYAGIDFEIKPLKISKLNTVVQSFVVILFLIIQAFGWKGDVLMIGAHMFVYVNILTIFFSGISYLGQGLVRLSGHVYVYAFIIVFVCTFVFLLHYMVADSIFLWQHVLCVGDSGVCGQQY